MPTIVVHGGAGDDAPAGREARRAGVERAADAGAAVLARGGTALDAAVEAVVVLEDDPAFNAGRGSVLTEDGGVEMDASVMSGADLASGAVGAVRGVANPVRAALAVLREGREVLLVGDPVAALARRHGLRVVDDAALVTPEALARWRRRRVGDSAVVGAGTYADDRLGAVSATGPGEAIIRLGLARVALARLGEGSAPDEAAAAALEELRARVGATAGLIVVAPDGRAGAAHTTAGMPTALRR
jgi:beta-aspartyl-peptidase (threonine type)